MPVRVFFPDASHTLACLIRSTIQSTSDLSIVSCVVNDDLIDPAGLVVRAESMGDVVRAIDDNLAWIRNEKSRLGLMPRTES